MIAPDARGHGESDGPPDAARDGEARMLALADPRFAASIVEFLA